MACWDGCGWSPAGADQVAVADAEARPTSTSQSCLPCLRARQRQHTTAAGLYRPSRWAPDSRCRCAAWLRRGHASGSTGAMAHQSRQDRRRRRTSSCQCRRQQGRCGGARLRTYSGCGSGMEREVRRCHECGWDAATWGHRAALPRWAAAVCACGRTWSVAAAAGAHPARSAAQTGRGAPRRSR